MGVVVLCCRLYILTASNSAQSLPHRPINSCQTVWIKQMLYIGIMGGTLLRLSRIVRVTRKRVYKRIRAIGLSFDKRKLSVFSVQNSNTFALGLGARKERAPVLRLHGKITTFLLNIDLKLGKQAWSRTGRKQIKRRGSRSDHS